MYAKYAQLRDDAGLTDYDVATFGHFSPSILSRWKNGKSTPTKKTRQKIANVLNVSANSFSDVSSDRQAGAIRVASYAIKLINGSVVELTPDQYEALQNAIDNFVNVWLDAHNIAQKD